MKLVLVVMDIGGPPALHDILSQLPRDFAAPIVVLPSFDVGILESSSAALRRTIALKVSVLHGKRHLNDGHVYFVKPDTTYVLTDSESGLMIDNVPGQESGEALCQTIDNFAKTCRNQLSAIFLSGRGKGDQIITGCQILKSVDSNIVVLDQLDSLVFDMGKQIIESDVGAREMRASEIAEFLVYHYERKQGKATSNFK